MSMNHFAYRHMRREDLPAVNLILSKAFTKARLDEGYKDAHVPPCHASFLEMYLAGFPEGCFVVENRQGLVGFAFSRLWGEVGWIGPVSVIPAAQEQGAGGALMGRAIHTLQNAGARVIGLETMPRNYRNLGFYGKLGFAPQQLTLDLHVPAPPSPRDAASSDDEPIFWGLSDSSERAALTEALEKFARKIDPYLSLSREIELARRFDYGDALLVRHAQRGVIGCAVAHSETYSIEEPRRFLKVNALLLDETMALEPMLQMLFAWAKREALETITIRTPARYHLAFAELLRYGFRIFHADVRMTLQGYHEVALPESFYLSKWE